MNSNFKIFKIQILLFFGLLIVGKDITAQNFNDDNISVSYIRNSKYFENLKYNSIVNFSINVIDSITSVKYIIQNSTNDSIISEKEYLITEFLSNQNELLTYKQENTIHFLTIKSEVEIPLEIYKHQIIIISSGNIIKETRLTTN